MLFPLDIFDKNRILGLKPGASVSNMAAGAVNLLGDQSSTLRAVRLFAYREVLAPMDAESPGLGVEVGLQHRRHLARPSSRSALRPNSAMAFSELQS